MAAYAIADVDVLDQGPYDEYRQQVPATLAPYGGTFLVRGGSFEVREGDWQPRRLVVIEFPDIAAARAWYTSPEYQRILPLRTEHANSRLLLVEGV